MADPSSAQQLLQAQQHALEQQAAERNLTPWGQVEQSRLLQAHVEQQQRQVQRAQQQQHGAGPCGKVARRAERPAKHGRDHPVAISWRQRIRGHEEGCLMSLVDFSETVRAAEACPRTRGVVELPARRVLHEYACSVDCLLYTSPSPRD